MLCNPSRWHRGVNISNCEAIYRVRSTYRICFVHKANISRLAMRGISNPTKSDFSSKALLCLFIRKADFIASLPRLRPMVHRPSPTEFSVSPQATKRALNCVLRKFIARQTESTTFAIVRALRLLIRQASPATFPHKGRLISLA